MTKTEVMAKVEAHNAEITEFTANGLEQALKEAGYKVVDGRVSLNAWFVSQQIIKEQNYYEKGMAILRELREDGWDVKMDMQSYKLSFKQRRI